MLHATFFNIFSCIEIIILFFQNDFRVQIHKMFESKCDYCMQRNCNAETHTVTVLKNEKTAGKYVAK